MSTFVLIHGGWHAAWCWRKLAPLLEVQGHRVIAPDLPAHGADSTPLSARPYELYVPKVCEVLDSAPEKVILVGHSSGGIIISEAARVRDECIQALVYLSAFLLPSGMTPRDVMAIDSESILRACLEIDSERGVSLVRKECARAVFYEDCSPQDAEWAIGQLQPEPLVPPGSSTSPPAEPPRRAPRFFIECLQDKALGISAQRWMYTSLRATLSTLSTRAIHHLFRPPRIWPAVFSK